MERILTLKKGKLLAAALAIGAAVWVILAFSGKEKEEFLAGALINQVMTDAELSGLEEELLTAAGGDAESQAVFVDATVTLDLDAQDVETMNGLSKLTTWIFGRSLDFMILEPAQAEHFAALNGLDSLDDPAFLGEAASGERLWRDSRDRPVGIRLSREFAERCGIRLSEPVFVAVKNSERTERLAKLAAQLMEDSASAEAEPQGEDAQEGRDGATF